MSIGLESGSGAFTYRIGQLFADGVALSAIAGEVGTPCYVYSRDRALANFRAVQAAFPSADIHYSLKANANLALVRALAEAGAALEYGAQRIYDNLTQAGWSVDFPRPMDVHALRTFPSTWARRLAHGRDPRSLILSGHLAYRTQNVLREVVRV